jgi:hypothetical protein
MYDGGIGRDALRNAIYDMMRDPARQPKPTPVRRPRKKFVRTMRRISMIRMMVA